ncbi:hypothetical protein F53441_13298 [Fusarium austroafricanum]|uniref:Uncharacterized protein n=1 Tax=Fusarium austroafricanum TaxID=2364996 RepID=A0A8H4JSL5_9HYPO|nr:hypothetical protein F53441_13298 [Fusarium austroafricanum]
MASKPLNTDFLPQAPDNQTSSEDYFDISPHEDAQRATQAPIIRPKESYVEHIKEALNRGVLAEPHLGSPTLSPDETFWDPFDDDPSHIATIREIDYLARIPDLFDDNDAPEKLRAVADGWIQCRSQGMGPGNPPTNRCTAEEYRGLEEYLRREGIDIPVQDASQELHFIAENISDIEMLNYDEIKAVALSRALYVARDGNNNDDEGFYSLDSLLKERADLDSNIATAKALLQLMQQTVRISNMGPHGPRHSGPSALTSPYFELTEAERVYRSATRERSRALHERGQTFSAKKNDGTKPPGLYRPFIEDCDDTSEPKDSGSWKEYLRELGEKGIIMRAPGEAGEELIAAG